PASLLPVRLRSVTMYYGCRPKCSEARWPSARCFRPPQPAEREIFQFHQCPIADICEILCEIESWDTAMGTEAKKILLIDLDDHLRDSRILLLEHAGYDLDLRNNYVAA